MSSVMRAIVVTDTSSTCLKLDSAYPRPTRQSGEVLVKVISSSVNPVDAIIGTNAYPAEKFPKVISSSTDPVDASLETSTGPALKLPKFKVGDAVFALTPDFWITSQKGTYTEYVSASEHFFARVPSTLPVEEAGGVPLVALTAWQALCGAKPQAGQKILILGASGGVGHFAVQFCKAAFGLHVVAVAGPDNQAFLKDDLKADEVVNYRTQKVEEVYAGTQFDIVFDTLGGEASKATYALLKPGGYFAHIHSPRSDSAFLETATAAGEKGEGPKTVVTFVAPNGEHLQKVADLIEAGKVKLVVAETVPLEVAPLSKVFKQLLAGSGIRGKVVIAVANQ